MTRLLKFALTLMLCSCSLNFGGENTDNPEVREVLLSLSSTYLINIVNGDFAEIDPIILWEPYFENKGKTYSREKYFNQLSNLDGRYTVKSHPLLNLKPGDFDINENDAELILSKDDSSDVELKFQWTGTAWHIVDDNLFGEEGIFSKLKKLSAEEKSKAGKVRQKKLNTLDLAL